MNSDIILLLLKTKPPPICSNILLNKNKNKNPRIIKKTTGYWSLSELDKIFEAK
jgi:hypothetical protein